MKSHDDKKLKELSTLFFATKQLIRDRLPDKSLDPNAWPRLETMRYIAREGEPTMQDIARYLRVTPPSATSFVTHLIRLKLVSRRVCKEDRRVARIRLTAKGKTELAAHSRRSVKALRDVFSKLNETEMRELVRILRRLQDRHRPR